MFVFVIVLVVEAIQLIGGHTGIRSMKLDDKIRASHCCFVLGVFLSLRGAVVVSDGYVDIDDIYVGTKGSNDNSNSLLCHTDAADCCRFLEGRGGWFLNDGSTVHSTHPVGGYRRNRGPGVVRLYRDNGSHADRGRFYCEIPNAMDINQTLYANIRKSNTAIYILSCINPLLYLVNST